MVTGCLIEGCDRPHEARGMCSMHYLRWKRHGEPKPPIDEGVLRQRPSCSVEGCDRPHDAQGYCKAHYKRWLFTGHPLGTRRPSVEARWHAKVDKNGPVPGHRPDLGQCWQWTGTVSRVGYGRISIKGRLYQAHRVGYEMLVGPIPDGLDLDHLCCNRLCVRPEHLEPVTRQENLLRGRAIAQHSGPASTSGGTA